MSEALSLPYKRPAAKRGRRSIADMEIEMEADRDDLSPADFAEKWQPFNDDLDLSFIGSSPASLTGQHAFTGQDQAALDALFVKYGLRAVICTLHVLMASRAGGDEFDFTSDIDSIMKAEKDGKAFTTARDRLGDIALDERIDVREA